MSLAALLMLAAAPAQPAQICKTDRPQDVAGGTAELKRLDRLPPAETYLTVLRREDGCVTPVRAREWNAGQPRRR